MRTRLPSKNNPWWTPTHDYKCAVEWCLRYPDWKKELRSLPDTSKGIAYDKDKVQTSNESKANLLESTAKACMPSATEYLIMGVTIDGITFNELEAKGIPYSKSQYFRIRQKFYHLIANKI